MHLGKRIMSSEDINLIIVVNTKNKFKAYLFLMLDCWLVLLPWFILDLIIYCLYEFF